MKRSLQSKSSLKKSFFIFSLMICLSSSFMSFSYLPVGPGKDKRNNKDKQKSTDPKGFATLLPTTQPVSLDPTTESVSGNAKSSDVKVALNPKVEDFADNYIHHEEYDLSRMKVWAKPVFKIMDNILEEYNLPKQLKYLAVIESSLQKNVRMSSGALGPWQLMPDEARRYGLLKNGHDYRTDYEKSTEAAAKLITSLHDRYHDWLLTIAAYNAGVGRVNKAIDQAGSSDFWKVQYYLPQETRNHVKKFISTHYFFEGCGGITTMSAKETDNYKNSLADNDNSDDEVQVSSSDENTVRIKGLYNEEAICKVLKINKNEFEKTNPDFNKTLADGKFYDVHLPKGKTDDFVSKRNQILQESFNELLGDTNKSNNLSQDNKPMGR